MAVGGAGAQIRSVAAGRIVVNLVQPASDLLATFGAGAKVYLESAASSAFSAPTVLSSTIIVSGTEQLEFVDLTGTSTTWYRVRVGNTGGTSYSDYSDGVQATSLLTYATIDDVAKTMPGLVQTDSKAMNLIADLLEDASDLITQICHRSFFRSPAVTGTETRTFNVIREGRSSLAEALGYGIDIVAGSISLFELTDATGGTFTTVTAGAAGYWPDPANPLAGWPTEDLLLSDQASQYRSYSVGSGTARITAAFGWAAIPRLVRRATVDLAREWYRQGPGGGGPVGINQFGTPVFGPGTPSTVIRLAKSDYTRRDYLNG